MTRGFEPVASEPHFHAGKHERSHGRFDRESGSRHSRNIKVEKVEKVDPWFMKPYEPGTPSAAGAQPATPSKAPIKKGGIGALLGGRSKT